MIFSSLLFLFRFLPVILILYFLAPKKFRNGILFSASLVFYAWGEPIYVVIMLFSTLVDYVHGRLVWRYKEKGQLNKAKLCVISSMIVNLGLLGFFKYADFFLTNINSIFHTSFASTGLALPIGISFYTFQTMSYTIDIYRGDAKLQKNIISFGTYVALFPQLIAGPIVKYKTISKELQNRKETFDSFSYGALRFLCGMGKKVLLANNIGLLWDQISATSADQVPVLMAWLGITAFAFQIYFDFSGYSDMAIGLGSMFGFHFPENFNYPYLSKSITEFWRRWHISLGSWFRDYVYIPLGGNRKGLASQIRNIAVVWLLTGFWHGASWNFVFWGVYYGIILLLEKFVFIRFLDKAPAWLCHTYAILLTWIGWTIFAFDDMGRGLDYLQSMFGMNGAGLWNTETLYIILNYGIILLLLIIGATTFPKRIAVHLMTWMDKKGTVTLSIVCKAVFVAAVFLLSVAYLVDATYNPFLYFRF